MVRWLDFNETWLAAEWGILPATYVMENVQAQTAVEAAMMRLSRMRVSSPTCVRSRPARKVVLITA
jgi:2-methylcitrate dehydratase PrpD